ncbi:MAG: N-acetyltransferase [Thermoplasmataceae archaeon]|jgi:ribosomal protein S18 acetylase RimI-like enzyme
MDTRVLLRKPREEDVEKMFEILENSLSQYLRVNDVASKNNRLIVNRDIVEEYVENDDYLCIDALIDSEIAGWIAGSEKNTILSEHGCSLGEFYIEEIVVDSRYRRRGVGSYLLSKIPMDNLKSIVVDTPLINQEAIAFYEHSGFVKVNGLLEEFSRNWTRMSKIV